MFAVIRIHFETRTAGLAGMGERDAEFISAYPIEPLETAWAIRASGVGNSFLFHIQMVGEKPEMEITSENLLARGGKPALYPKDESREEVTYL